MNKVELLCQFITEGEVEGSTVCGGFAKFLASNGIDSGAKCLDSAEDMLCYGCPFYEEKDMEKWANEEEKIWQD